MYKVTDIKSATIVEGTGYETQQTSKGQTIARSAMLSWPVTWLWPCRHTSNKMADVEDDFFVYGDDLGALFDLLEQDEAIEEQFLAAVSDVSTFH